MTQMEPLPPFNSAVIELGRRLVDALASERHDDVLSKWMVHHVASLMIDVERAMPGPQRAEAERACMEGVLRLWAHRSVLPNGARPFENAEAALGTLTKLDPTAADNFYFRLRERHDESDADESAKWLRSAEGVDLAARAVIRFCLGQALAKDRAGLAEWVELTKSLDAPSDWDVVLVSSLAEVGKESEPAELARRNEDKARDLSKKVASLIPVLQALQKDLDAALHDDALPPPPSTP
jgi:hypothetical protein